MKCTNCGKEFEGNFCPNCGASANAAQPVQPAQPVYQQPAYYQNQYAKPKKKKGWLIALIIIVVLLILIIVGVNSCGSSQPQAVSSSPTAMAGAKSDSSESTSKKLFKVGEVVKYNNMELSVTKVQKTKGGEYDSPKAGCEYVVVTVKYKNDGKENISYNPLDFKMKNSKGQITSESYMSGNDSELHSGDLAPNGDVEGTIAFEEPKGDNGLVLQYTGNIFESESEVDFKLS
ncbi:MAG TPA: DUF4352 domain-containing protein [Caproicibacter sp.]|nr:DUF4352 domain-containing protein [Caproicibacter sp.]